MYRYKVKLKRREGVFLVEHEENLETYVESIVNAETTIQAEYGSKRVVFFTKHDIDYIEYV